MRTRCRQNIGGMFWTICWFRSEAKRKGVTCIGRTDAQMGEDTDPGTFTGAAAAACGRSGAAGANACLLSACVSAAAVSSAGTRPGGGRCGLLCAGHGPVFISETVYGTGGAAPGDAAHPDLHRDLPTAGASAADIVKRRGLLYDKAIYRANAAGKHPAPVFIAGARAYTGVHPAIVDFLRGLGRRWSTSASGTSPVPYSWR